MRTESGFTRKFPPWKNGTKVSGVPVCWLIIAGHLKQTFHRQNVRKPSTVTFQVTHIFSVIQSTSKYRFVTNFNLASLKNFVLEKRITTYLNSAQNMLSGLPASVRVTKHKNHFVIQRNQYIRLELHFAQHTQSTNERLPRRDGDHLPASSADVKNKWSYTSTLPICHHGVDKENFYIITAHSNTKPQAPDNRKMSHVKSVYVFPPP